MNLFGKMSDKYAAEVKRLEGLRNKIFMTENDYVFVIDAVLNLSQKTLKDIDTINRKISGIEKEGEKTSQSKAREAFAWTYAVQTLARSLKAHVD